MHIFLQKNNLWHYSRAVLSSISKYRLNAIRQEAKRKLSKIKAQLHSDIWCSAKAALAVLSLLKEQFLTFLYYLCNKFLDQWACTQKEWLKLKRGGGRIDFQKIYIT